MTVRGSLHLPIMKTIYHSGNGLVSFLLLAIVFLLMHIQTSRI